MYLDQTPIAQLNTENQCSLGKNVFTGTRQALHDT